MTVKEQETYHAVHLRRWGTALCEHRFPQRLTSHKSFVTCPWCKYELEQEGSQNHDRHASARNVRSAVFGQLVREHEEKVNGTLRTGRTVPKRQANDFATRGRNPVAVLVSAK